MLNPSQPSKAKLTYPSDDLTVQVIFFGHGEKTGEVTVNREASAEDGIRPKL